MFILIVPILFSAKAFALKIQDNKLLLAIGVIAISMLAFYAEKKLGKATMQLTINKQGINTEFLRQFPFKREQNNFIYWSEIESYVLDFDQSFDIFKIQLKNNRQFVVRHSSWDESKDDFNRFIADFKTAINDINNISSEAENKIDRGKSFYEKPIELVVALFQLIFLVVGPILLFRKHLQKTPDHFLFIGFYLTNISLLLKFYYNRKAARKNS